MRTPLVLMALLVVGGIAAAQDAPPSTPAAPPATPVGPAPAAKPPEKPLTPEQAADAVLAAVKAKKQAAVKTLAATDNPDPWLVADELIRRREFDAADAFAKAAPRVDVEKLPEYVASRRGRPDDAARRARIATAYVAHQIGKFADALEALGPEEPGPIADMVGVRLAMGRGHALGSLMQLNASAAAFLTAGEAAEKFGWLARALWAFHKAGDLAFRASTFVTAGGAWERQLSISERRGDHAGAAGTLLNIGNVHLSLGEYAKALSTYERALAAKEALGDQAGAASALGGIGVAYYRLGDHAKALATQERALAAHEAMGDRAGAARTLGSIGSVHSALGDYAKALATQERALAAHEAMGDKAEAAKTLSNIGSIYKLRGDYAKALATQERALAAMEALGDQAAVATTLVMIGSVHFALGDYAKALATQERALAAKESLGDRAGAALTLGLIGDVYERLGDHAKALATQERALAAMEALGMKGDAATRLVWIGNVHLSLGDYAKALATYERALAAQEAMGDRAGGAATLSNIGIVHASLGDYAKALSIYERALSAQEVLGDRPGAATTLGWIGNVHLSLGDYAKALAIYERLLAAHEAMRDRAGAAAMLGNIGAVHECLGDYAKALSIYERALAALEALGARAGAARTLGNIGSVYRALGDYARALATQERALAAMEALGEQAGAASTLVRIGSVHFALGDYAKAILFLERAGRAAEKLGAIGLQVGTLQGLAAARLGSGDAGRAVEAAHEAVSLLKTLVGGLGEEQGATAREKYASLFSTGLRAATKANDASEAAFFLESGRAGTLLESLGSRGLLRAALVPEELRVAEDSARAREARALVAYTKALDAGDVATIRARRNELDAARAGIVEVVERIQRDAKRAARVLYPVATPVKDIQGFLAPEEAFVLHGLAAKDEPAHALVLTKDEARIVALGASSAIVAACEALEANDASVDPTAAFERLRTLLIAPLALAKGTKRLLVSPDGPLSYVPFATLAPDLVVAYQASGSTYGVLREEKDERGTQVLALADPDYAVEYAPISLDLYAPGALATTGPTRGGRLAPLPGTRAEATAVADVRLFGKDASEAGLRTAVAARKERWHAVHFACHGRVNPDRPTLSSLALTPDGTNDGFLTALEVLKMEIPTDLVVLSACETGKGKIVGGEGIVGLTRAFMYAGAPRVLCSLWKVDDDATRALMTKFYELWNPKDGKPGLPTAEALKRAQEYVRDHPGHPKWKHPYYWAAWVLWGLPD